MTTSNLEQKIIDAYEDVVRVYKEEIDSLVLELAILEKAEEGEL